MSQPPWRGFYSEEVPLARYTSWRVGGRAAFFYQPVDMDDLSCFLAHSDRVETPITWLGFGSNVLIRDSGIPGIVIHTTHLNRLAQSSEKRVKVEAGVGLPQLARFAAQQGLSGLEFLIGIPGTVGGALAMNAGAFGHAIWDRVCEVETIDCKGIRQTRSPDDFQVGYRHVSGVPGEWFVSCQLRLATGEVESIRQTMKGYLDHRHKTQPIGQASCGSVFKNPSGHAAGQLIDRAGLKGFQIGDAQVSHKHANFIINLGKAHASDIEALMAHIQQSVAKMAAIRLETEVVVLG